MSDKLLERIEEMEEVDGLSIIVHQNIDAGKIIDFKRIAVDSGGIASEIKDGWIIIRIQTEKYGESYATYAYLVKLKAEQD